MPCQSEGFGDRERSEVQAELDRVTRLLCYVVGTLDAETVRILTIPAKDGHSREARELGEWLRAHLAADKARREREERKAREAAARASALAKLTPEERKALGLK